LDNYPTKISSELQKLAPNSIIELFELDADAFGGDVYYFHAGTNELTQTVTWQGQEYLPYPVQITGFEFSAGGQLPRPKMVVSNLTGIITALVLAYDDLLGAKVTRKRTMQKYLDAINFDGGVNPNADPTAEFPDDIYYIERKIGESKTVVEFELSASFDVQGVRLPRRQIIQNICPWKYRGAECGYTGTNYFNTSDVAVGTLAQDACGKRVSSCEIRFGTSAELPYGGFPAASLLK
jgi:lambda family phage minor tail protein L